MTPSVSIFLKVYPADYPWVKYCFQSIARFCAGFESVVVVSDKGTERPPVGTLEQHFEVELKGKGYDWQQVCKINADAFVTSEHILFIDADTVFTQPVTPEMFFKNGKPIWLYEPYENLKENPDVVARQPVVSRFVGQPVEHEFMRRHPFIVSRDVLADLRRFCWRQHGISIDEYVMRYPNPSEFNFIGAYGYVHRRSAMAWLKPEEAPTVVWQGWSHGGLTKEIEDDLRRAVA